MKKKLERRLFYLYSGELFCIVLFIFVSYIFNSVNTNLRLYSLCSFWVSFLLLECFLLQGTIYWYSKWKRIKIEKTSITPIKVVRRLHSLKTLNIVLIIIPIFAFLFDFIKWYSSLPIGGLLVVLFIYIFAVLEYINYFYIQLSYDNISDLRYLLKSREFKQSCMNKDFKRML